MTVQYMECTWSTCMSSLVKSSQVKWAFLLTGNETTDIEETNNQISGKAGELQFRHVT